MDINNTLRKMIITKMQNGDYELKPCPFCGNKPILEKKAVFEKLDKENNGACIGIRCNQCSLDLYEHTHDEHDYYIRAFLITEKWNRRAE